MFMSGRDRIRASSASDPKRTLATPVMYSSAATDLGPRRKVTDMTCNRPMLSVLALLAASFSMASHGETQQEIVQKNLRKEIDPRQIVVTLERTQCFGSCPAYRVTLTGAGEVEYEGKALVKVTGVRRTTLPQEEVLKIVNELLRVRIFDAAPEYDSQDSINSNDGNLTLGSIVVSDLSSIYLQLRIGTHAKRVRLYSNVPKELGAIPDLIDQVTNVEQWIGTDCERPRSSMGPTRPAGECER